MNENQIALVQGSFNRLQATGKDIATMFYDRLFRESPSSAALFKGDLALQKKKLMTTIALVVKGLQKFDELREAILELGARHVDYGVHPDDFPDVATALLHTFNDALDDFTLEEEAAWKEALGAIASVMLEAWQTPARRA